MRIENAGVVSQKFDDSVFWMNVGLATPSAVHFLKLFRICPWKGGILISEKCRSIAFRGGNAQILHQFLICGLIFEFGQDEVRVDNEKLRIMASVICAE